LLLFFLLSLLCCTRPKLDETTVAIVNGERISKQDLEFSAAFFSQYAPSKRGEQALRAHLDLLIEKKLFAQQGRRLGFDKSPHVQQVTEWVKRDEMIRALYQKEIRDKVSISEEEIKAAFFRGLESIHVRHLFVKTEEEARQLKRALDAGITFEEIAAQTFQDSTLRSNGGDLGFLTYDEMDADFAEAAFSLPMNQVSEPVRSKWGYHIIRVDERRQQVFAGQTELQQKRAKIERNLRQEIEKKKAGEFVEQYMRPFNVQMLNSGFNILAAEIQKMVIAGNQMLPDYRPAFAGDDMNRLASGLEAYGDQVLIAFTGGQWTIADFLAKVRALPAPNRPRIDTPNHLRHDIGVMIRNEFLVQEADKRGLDKDQAVMAEVKKWQDEFTFGEYWSSVHDTIAVTEAVTAAYFAEHQGLYLMPDRVHVREILVATKAKAEKLLQRLRSGEDFAELATAYSLRKWAAAKGGDLDFLTSGQYRNISLKAMLLQEGEIVGPIAVPEGFSIIQCLAHQATRPMTFEEAKEQVALNARSAKEERIYADMREALRRKANIQINDEMLTNIAKEMPPGERVQISGTRTVP